MNTTKTATRDTTIQNTETMKKSYNDIEKQVNRIIVNYLVDDFSKPLSDRHAAIACKVRLIQRRYTFNINQAEGFAPGLTFEEVDNRDHSAMYHVYKSASKRYPRRIYAGD